MIGELINRGGFKIVTERLVICPAKTKDAKYYLQGFNRNITRYQFPEPFANVGEARKFIREFTIFRYLGIHLVANIVTKEGMFVGSVEVSNLDTMTPGLGIWICEAYQHNGYGYEALKHTIAFFRERMPVTYFIYEVDRRNVESVALVHKLQGEWYSYREAESDNGDILELECYKL